MRSVANIFRRLLSFAFLLFSSSNYTDFGDLSINFYIYEEVVLVDHDCSKLVTYVFKTNYFYIKEDIFRD